MDPIFMKRITTILSYSAPEILVDKQSGDFDGTVTGPHIRFPVVTLIQMYASNDTQLVPSANSSTLQNIAFPVFPNNEEQRNRKRMLSSNMETPEEKDEGDSGLNDNAIDIDVEIRRKMERTTIEVRNYPPVTEATPSPITANVISDPEHVADLSMHAIPIPLPLISNYPHGSHGHDSGTRTTVSYASLSSSLSSGVAHDQHHIREVIQLPNITELFAIPSFISASAPVALPIPLAKIEISPNLFDTQLQNFGINTLISDGQYFRNSGRMDTTNTDGVLEQRQSPEKIPVQMQVHAREYKPVDDILGCTWDIVTNSCKDLFSLKLCSHCHDFGNIFLHNCKCLVKYRTAF
ncbi:hypothetical protein LOAG_04799 [Loa loa]|uniref:Uncharacterized protein n=1 Tax=Loa loa TaxID=7209 RepID=A0A1S0U388_LOALO|nr:hypothetical protein LOAG_04799 [Loa loa]EFO23687.1 hypothetical protein LOAG_04799 [Loa loa]